MTTTEQKLDAILAGFQRDGLYEDIRRQVESVLEDVNYTYSEQLERIEDKLDRRVECLRETVSIIVDELGKVNQALSLLAGVQDAST